MTTGIQLKVGKIRSGNPNDKDIVRSVNNQLADLKSIVQGIFDQIEAASPQICLDAVKPTFDLSQMYCPVDKGKLKASGYCEIVEGAKGRVRIEVGYAKGGDPGYAVYVHEMPYYHLPPTRSKFLQAAMMEDLTNIHQRLVVSYSGMFGGQP